MSMVEPYFNQNAGQCRECVLCGGALHPRNREWSDEEPGEFCADCTEQEFANDALELWSWFCGSPAGSTDTLECV